MIQPVTMYEAVCDGCGINYEFGDYSCLNNPESVKDDISANGWFVDEINVIALNVISSDKSDGYSKADLNPFNPPVNT